MYMRKRKMCGDTFESSMSMYKSEGFSYVLISLLCIIIMFIITLLLYYIYYHIIIIIL